MINLLKCKHKFSDLAVNKEDTEKPHKVHKEYIVVTHHLFCTSCDTRLNLEHVKLIKK